MTIDDAPATVAAGTTAAPAKTAPLKWPRREAFAHALARGRTPGEAALEAGYSSAKKGAALARRQDIAQRCEDLRVRIAWGGSADLAELIEELRLTTVAARGLNTAPGLVAARAAIAEAARLKQLLPLTSPVVQDLPPRLSPEEWLRIYGPEAQASDQQSGA